jgi:hypothetical protein
MPGTSMLAVARLVYPQRQHSRHGTPWKKPVNELHPVLLNMPYSILTRQLIEI